MMIGQSRPLTVVADLTVRARPFRFGELPGDRGVVIEVGTPYSGAVFSSAMPDVFLTDNGEVEFGECRVPVVTFRRWAEAVLSNADAREGRAE